MIFICDDFVFKFLQRRLKNESDATAMRLELMGRQEVLREEVNKMEQQYEKTKPLMNLVDNMVKLGSLYRAGSMQWDTNSMSSGMNLQRLRVNQKDLERRLQMDDQKHWNKFDSNQIELQVSEKKCEIKCCHLENLHSIFIYCRIKCNNCTNWINDYKRSPTICRCCNKTKMISKVHWRSSINDYSAICYQKRI